MSDPSKYTVGWISAITTELVAAQQFLDERHDDPEHTHQHDNNVYTLGKIGRHNVVMASLPKGEYGTTMAATVARDMLHSFPNIRVGLMVGIAGGAPSAKQDVRLGDIVVSSRDGTQGGVFEYDYGKAIQGQAFQHTQVLNQAPALLRAAVGGLEAQYEADGHDLQAQVAKILDKKPRLRKKYSRPPRASDKLYRSDFVHSDSSQSCSDKCGEDPADLVSRPERGEDEDDPAIHYGLIASANKLMKNAQIRDKLAADKGVLCFEMEAAGLMNHFPCLVIRGICDYADSHKNKEWQGYAAMTSAAYAKDLLLKIPPNRVEAERRIAETLETLDHIGRQVDETTVTVKEVKSAQHSEKIQRWLCPPDPSVNANHARDLRCKKTGGWLLEHTMFQSWMSGSPQHLWLQGLAGCGKTVLSATVLDALAEAGGRLVLSFFFDFSDKEKQTLDGMLRSLACQLYQSTAPCTAQLDALFRASGGGEHQGGANQNGLKQPTTKALSDVVSKMLKDNARVCIVLDALDESTTRSKLLTWLGDVTSKPELRHVQIFCTGRPEPEFLARIPSAIGSESCILLDKTGVNADIREYVATQLAGPDFQDKRLSQDLEEQIKARVGDGADGMFQWATCQMDSLARCPSPKAIKTTLQRLPRNLDETYERMISSIPEDLLGAAMRLLQFLVQAPRPLTVQEAIDVIATDTTTEPGGFDKDGRVFMDNDVLRFCPSLLSIVEVRESWGSRFWGVTRKELHLAHFSVKEFLMLRADFEQPACGVVITTTCLAYLAGIEGHYRKLDEETFWGETFDRESLNRDYPMARLAAEIWTTHAAWAESHDGVFQATLAFLEDHDMFQRWGRLYQADRPSARDLGPPQGSLLYYACLAGLMRVAQELVNKGAEVKVRGGHLGTPLQAACYGGHGDIVQLLIARGADVSVQEGHFGTALQAASFGGHMNVVKLLLEKGADVNVQHGMYGNALQAASWQGHGDIVELLLQEGANVNAIGGQYNNALQAASDAGHAEIVRLLLEKGADVSARVYQHGNALYAASRQGCVDIVEILLEYGADVKGGYGPFGAPLEIALHQGHDDVARLLIRAGAEIEDIPFSAAKSGRSQETIKLLLEEGADVDARNRSFRSETIYYPSVYLYAPPSASRKGPIDLPPGLSVEMDDL